MPFWGDLRGLIYELLLGGGATQEKPIEPVDPETARAIVAVCLAGLFATKTAKNFGVLPRPAEKVVKKVQAKAKTQ
ncbi:hypothetical protein NMY22_g18119 [Coprinellus aureogranulatus]|nr:hypothetical protein NMY22_g18119 [Coprinellus aureogranulatus]